MELNQVSLPDLSTAWSNYVLVCSADNLFLQHGETGPDNYVVITYAGQQFIFNCKAHQACQPGQIALGKSHRLTINPADGTLPPKVTCAPFSLAERDQIIEAVEVTFSLNLLKAIRETTLQENKLAEHIAATYTGQVLHQGQVIYCLYNNNIPCELRVTQLSVAVTGMIDSTRTGDEQDQSLDFQPAKKALLRQGLTAVKVDETTSADKNHFMKLVKTSDAPAIIAPSFDFMKLGIGALDKEFNQIFRRAFASRLFPPELVRKLGINHVRGMLLFGPPGTGKTLIARRIGQMLGGKCEPLIVNGPEILDKYVGVAEEKIRKLFEPAEQDAKDNGDRAELHTIIFDEIDAICKARGSVRNGTGVHDTVVNQLLSKLDGVKSINNILVIGMTNRPDMIDPALLRPGRLEVKIEIGLPDRAGREQILRIHTADMMKNKMCDPNLDFTILSDRTRNMSGAELAGVVTSAASHALYGKLDVKNIALTPEFMKDLARKRVQVKMFNFEQALEEVKPAFGVAEDDFATYLRSQLLPVGPEFDRVMDTVRGAVQQLKSSATMQVMTVLIDGPSGSGKSTMAARLAVETEFPFIKLVSAEQFVGMDESSKCNIIDKVFTDSYKSPLSLIMLDNLERLMEFVEIGPRFSNVVLQTLMVLIQRLPPKAERKLCIVATTANLPFLKRVGLRQSFGIVTHAPLITKPEQVLNTIRAMGMPVTESDKPRIAQFVVGLQRQLAIKHLVMVLEMANRGQGQITFERFQEALIETGLVSPGDMESDSEELKGQN